MPDWFLALHGSDFDLLRLVAECSEPPLTVRKEGTEFRLRHESLNGVTDERAARSELDRYLIRINSLGWIYWGDDFDGVEGRGLKYVAPSGGVIVPLAVALEGKSSLRVREPVRFDERGEVIARAGPLPHRVSLAVNSDDVDDALYFLQRHEPSWGELYKAYEIVHKATGDIPSRGWVSRPELKRFKHSANHQAAAGRDARHARLSTDPPKNPMSLEDASIVIRHVVGCWLDSL